MMINEKANNHPIIARFTITFFEEDSMRLFSVIHTQNGFVSQKNSSKEYIKLIANILDNINNYKNVLNNAFKFAKLNFNDKKYIKEIKKHYDDLS